MARQQKRSGGGPRRKSPAAKEAQAPPEKPVDGILVQLGEEDEKGGRDISVATLGTVKTTELPALLGMARRIIEQQLGIGGG